MKRRFLGLVSAVATVVSCAPSTAPDVDPVLEFASHQVEYGTSESSIDGGASSILFRGRLPVGGGGYAVRAESSRQLGGDVDYVLHVFADRVAPGIAFPVAHAYSGRLTGVAPGDVAVRVVQVVSSGGRRDEAVFEEVITVARS